MILESYLYFSKFFITHIFTNFWLIPLMDLRQFIRNVPDFPKAGINFKDITPLVKDPAALRRSTDDLRRRFEDIHYDLVMGIESRGFIFGSIIASDTSTGFIPVRKPGKLPYRTIRQSYALEYGSNELEIHEDAIAPGHRILIIDDVLATGGTAAAAAALAEQLGGTVVGIGTIIELSFLKGRERLGAYRVESLIAYDAE